MTPGSHDAKQITSPGAKIKSQRFGVAKNSGEIPLGILGLSPPLGPADDTYPFVLDSLAEQGFINSRTFSLDLRGVDSPDGEFLSPHDTDARHPLHAIQDR